MWFFSLRNGYSNWEIEWTMRWFDRKRQVRWQEDEEEPIRGIAVVPFYQPITNQLISLLRVLTDLRRQAIITSYYPLTKLRQKKCGQ